MDSVLQSSRMNFLEHIVLLNDQNEDTAGPFETNDAPRKLWSSRNVDDIIGDILTDIIPL